MDQNQSKNNKKKEMSFLQHLEELRWCLIKSVLAVVIGMLCAFPLSGYIIDILTLPNNNLANPPEMVFLKPAGMLLVRMGVSITAGIIVAFPVIFYQIWKFISPALLSKERKIIWPVVTFSTLCFLLGISFAYFVMLPFILPFLYSLGTETIKPTINVSEYIGFSVQIILVAGLVFELPVASFVLTKIGLLSPKILRKYRRYGIIIIFILSAFLTPPDPGSQVLLAVPLLVLYEISIGISVLAYRKRKKQEELLAAS